MRKIHITNKKMDNLINLPFQNADLHYWTNVAQLLLEIAIMATPLNKIYQILLSINYVYMFVDLGKRLFVKKIKNTAINIDYSLSLSNDSVTHMLIHLLIIIPCLFQWFK